jgi:hypothetical protein
MPLGIGSQDCAGRKPAVRLSDWENWIVFTEFPAFDSTDYSAGTDSNDTVDSPMAASRASRMAADPDNEQRG